MSDPLDRPETTSRKDRAAPLSLSTPSDSLAAWITHYQQFAVAGVRSPAVAAKIALHLDRFLTYFQTTYQHDHISTCLRRDVLGWQTHLQMASLAPATVNNHLASLSAFTTWVHVHAPHLFPLGDPAKGIRELALPPLEPHALTDDQVRSLKSVCDRLPRFHQLKGRQWQTGGTPAPLYPTARPWRDRAIVFLLLATGLRREELIRLDLEQVTPYTPAALRAAHRGRITRVRGKGQTERSVFLSADARTALADYLQREHPTDAPVAGGPLFLSAHGLPERAPDGRLSPRALNLILTQIGRWHDAEIADPTRHISPLHPHTLRHTFAFHLARATGADAYELERRLGHRSQRYIARYTNPPEAVAASYVEEF